MVARYPEKIQQYARTLRRNQTRAELWIWQALRDRRFSGFKLRRQVPIGPYIVDFYCHQKKLVIELDGGQHNIGNAIQYDLRRSHFLQLQGLQVIRFWNNDVLKQKDAILQRIWDLLMTLEPSPDKWKRWSRSAKGCLLNDLRLSTKGEPPCTNIT